MTPFASAITQRLGRRPSLWLAAFVPVIAITGFLFSNSLVLWFVCILIEGMAAGLRWVLAEAIVAEFSPAHQRGRNVGIFETMVGTTFVLGPLVLAWFGAQSDTALWLALALTVFGLGWSLLIPRLPAAADAHSAQVGVSGVWHALRAHPLIMSVGFVGGFFESGLTSILPLYGLALGLGATAAALPSSAVTRQPRAAAAQARLPMPLPKSSTSPRTWGSARASNGLSLSEASAGAWRNCRHLEPHTVGPRRHDLADIGGHREAVALEHREHGVHRLGRAGHEQAPAGLR
eukprot:gene50045-67024_t